MTLPLRFLFRQFLWLLLIGGASIQAQNAEAIKARYEQRVAAADKIKSEFLAKISKDYESTVKQAQEELKRIFDSAIQSAAVRNRTDEVRQLTLEREALLGGSTASTASTGQGNDYKDLLGTWATSPESSFSYSFEFKKNKDVIHVYTYSSQSETNTQTMNFRASQKDNKIIIASSNKSLTTWEIDLPFDPNDLKITRHYTSSDGKSSNSNSYKLIRQQ